MTALEKLCRANRWRVKDGALASDETDGFNGHFLMPFEGELWLVTLSEVLGWRHCMVSNAQKLRVPGWSVMDKVRSSFFGDDAWVVQFHSPPAEHLNEQPFCLHLWEYLDGEMPHPEIVLL